MHFRGLCVDRSVADAMPRAERLIQLAQAGTIVGTEIAVVLQR
jgi:hypothetical protein